MQVFVNRSDLTLGADQAVRVVASYDDGIEIDPTAHGPNMVMLRVPSAAITMTGLGTEAGIGTLASGWREKYKQSIAGTEATQRIEEVFSEYSQRNSVAELNGYILSYGTDLARWPVEAQQRKVEIDRCWNYVNAVRAKAGALIAGALPADPSSNAYWPTRIAAYQPALV